jgi:VanZ family protein
MTNTRILNLSHIPIFIFLSIVALQFYALFRWPSWLRITIPLGLLVFVSLATELIQTVIPGRCGSFGDFKLNVIGIIYGSLLFSLIRKWKPDLIRRFVCE